MRLVDTHNHLDFPDFDADRAALLQRSRALGVERQVVLGVYRENWQRVWDLAQAEDGLYAALGLHPVYLARHRPQHLDDLRQWLQRLRGETKLCAVGEIGLDLAQANRLRKVAAELPAEAIVLETDAPDMAPSMHPGQRNSPEHLPAICRTLAELRGVDAEELAASSSRNAAELFGWD